MNCLDSTFCIDVLNGIDEAIACLRSLESGHVRLAIPAPALTEFLVGAFARGGKRLAQALEFAAQLEVLEVSPEIALDAARLGGECFRRGHPVGNIDLLIAATSMAHHAALITRDEDFARIPGLTSQSY